MKKLSLLFCSLAFITFQINAQQSLRKLRFGLRAAPQLTWIKADYKSIPKNETYENGGVKVGFSWGPQVEIQMNDQFAIQTGVDVNYSSGKVKGTITNFDTIFTLNQNYKMRFIEIPFGIKARTKEIGYLRYFFNIGLSAGFRYRANTEFSTSDNKNNNNINTDINKESKTYVNVFRGAYYLGGGVEYSLSGNTSLVGGLVFNNGITNLLKSQNSTNVKNGNLADERGILNYLQLNVGILF
jgi:hypothetical protein